MRNENRMFIHDRQQNYTVKYYIKRLLLPFLDMLYESVLRIKKNRSGIKKKYKVSICAIFKNEAKYLNEWITYHLLIGVDHFYLYNNNSNDDFKNVLASYIDNGIVELIEWPMIPGQFPAYEHCFVNRRGETQWISFLDIDEFICPLYETNINDWLKNYSHYPSIAIYWKMFGTSGLLQEDVNKLVIEQYTVCWEKLDDVSKVLFNTDFEVANYTNHHFMEGKLKVLGFSMTIPPVNEFKKFIKYEIHRAGFKSPKDSTIQINHYWSKSYRSMEEKFSRGDVNNHDRDLNLFYWHEHKNKSSDFKIWRYLIQLKVNLKKLP
ncbi:hypothetical protein IWX76_003239 [Pedobacter sp. CAN_A7]|uniref:glycosyltransferase family 92 protein n=1 Tax=Pedobacter sp. CAN_A7 TaxID=2787722 RepID=UPI0018CA1498